jgi:hypothetical protein
VKPRRPAEWPGIGFDAWLLGFEVAQVAWLILLSGERAERANARRLAC